MWRHAIYLWVGRCNKVKISIPLKLIFKFNVIAVKIPARFMVGIDKIVLKFIWKAKETRMIKIILKNKMMNVQSI